MPPASRFSKLRPALPTQLLLYPHQSNRSPITEYGVPLAGSNPASGAPRSTQSLKPATAAPLAKPGRSYSPAIDRSQPPVPTASVPDWQLSRPALSQPDSASSPAFPGAPLVAASP